MLDAGETFLSEFIDYIVSKHNDPSVVYSTPSQPSLHSYFARPIVCCHVPDFVLTAEKVKKIIADTRRHVTDMVMRWERSGNGSNQLIDEELFKLCFIYLLAILSEGNLSWVAQLSGLVQ